MSFPTFSGAMVSKDLGGLDSKMTTTLESGVVCTVLERSNTPFIDSAEL